MAGVRSVVLYGSEVAGVRSVVLYGGEMAGVRSGVLYGGEMAGVRQVSGVLFSMVVRWQVSGRCQECCSLW